MTLAEQLAQITAICDKKAELLDASGSFVPAKARGIYSDGIGHVARPSDDGLGGSHFRDVRQTVALVNALQQFALEQTRLGIPVKGCIATWRGGRRASLNRLRLASSWDPELPGRVFAVAGA